MVGGLDYGQSQFNRAAQALRQPGSAFKLFVYLAGVEEGLTPDSRWTDGPVAISTATGPWTPRNYGDRYYGEVTLREAFARSLNSVAVQVAQGVGPKKVAAAAKRLGITTPLEATPSLALGASEVTLLELTGAYATLANGGNGVFPFGIQRIVSREGVLLYDRSGAGPGRLVSPRDLGRMNDMLQATVGWGTGRRAEPGRPAAGKTGTSQDFRDAWFLGFTADLVAGVWVGNDDGKPMKEVTGGSLPAEIWKGVMVRALEGVPPRPLQGPAPGPEDDAASGDFLSNLFDRLIGGGSGGGSSGASNPQRGSSDPAAPAAGGRLPPAGSDR
jgi:penicillin-binding protein 1A